MTRLITCGFETGDHTESGTTVIGTNCVASVVGTTPTPRGGNYCLKLAWNGSGSMLSSYKNFAFASKTEIWLRCAIYLQNNNPSSGTAEWQILQFNDNTGAAQVSLTYSLLDGMLRAYRSTTILLGTSPLTMPLGGWHLLEVRHQLLSVSTGAMEVWLDSTRVINFSGDVANTANVNVASVWIGMIGTTVFTAGTTAYIGIDDVAINDVAGTVNNGRPGEGRIVLLTPTAGGSSTQFTRGGTDSGTNYGQVDETPPSMTDYVFSSTAAQRDLYTMSDLPGGLSVASINCVDGVVLAQNSDAGAGSLGLTINSGGTVNEGTAQTLGTTAAYLHQLWELNPNGNVAWTSTAVNNAEVGATCR